MVEITAVGVRDATKPNGVSVPVAVAVGKGVIVAKGVIVLDGASVGIRRVAVLTAFGETGFPSACFTAVGGEAGAVDCTGGVAKHADVTSSTITTIKIRTGVLFMAFQEKLRGEKALFPRGLAGDGHDDVDTTNPGIACIQAPGGCVGTRGLGSNHIHAELDFSTTANTGGQAERIATGLHFCTA